MQIRVDVGGDFWGGADCVQDGVETVEGVCEGYAWGVDSGGCEGGVLRLVGARGGMGLREVRGDVGLVGCV